MWSESSVRDEFERILKDGNEDPRNIRKYRSELAALVLRRGIPSETEAESRALSESVEIPRCTLRGRIWKALLGVPAFEGEQYISAVDNARNFEFEIEEESNIDGDCDRTFKGDDAFKNRVPSSKLYRVLATFVANERDGKYLQGMNTCLGPVLYVMPEVDAYFTMKALFEKGLKSYFEEKYIGVYATMELIVRVLDFLSQEDESFASSDFVDRVVGRNRFSFQSDYVLFVQRSYKLILSFFSSMKPLESVLTLWDVFFAVGFHFITFAVVALFHQYRDDICKCKPGGVNMFEFMEENVDFHRLRSDAIGFARLVSQRDPDLFESCVQSAYDIELCKKLKVTGKLESAVSPAASNSSAHQSNQRIALQQAALDDMSDDDD